MGVILTANDAKSTLAIEMADLNHLQSAYKKASRVSHCFEDVQHK
jgi:hypothetical protein